MTTDTLLSARLKFARAEHHIKDLKSQVGAFFESHYTVILKDKPEIGERSLFVRADKPIPDHFGLLIGDAAQNLRSALDHAVWAFVAPHSPHKPEKIQWPFVKNANDLERSITERGIHLAGQDVVRIVRDSRPHFGGDEYLFGLHLLSNADKHRVVTPVASLAHFENFDLAKIDPAAPEIRAYAHFGGLSFENQDILTWRPRPDGAAIENNKKIAGDFQIVFGKKQPFVSRGVIQTLTHCARRVSRVLDKFRGLVP